ncbi:MAG TPA: tRNA (N6-isopentenyl adenosine(37)-C2)-methylthiotransferase MiaB [Limnochordia bacterium]|nr:tRNA (N6-isopentenyl adenosine(37)-C2)-methylthiotransferase MiaB [Limnochordia bacterium]
MPVELPVIGQIEEQALDARLAELAKLPGGEKRVLIQTLGCQMNEHDTEKILGMLADLGYRPTSDPIAADLILYNTCCVRENPERKVYGQVHSLRQLKARRPSLKIGICGCMTQQRAELRRMESELEHVDLIFGTHNIHRLPELLHKVEVTGERVIEVWHEEGDVIEGLPIQREGKLKAYVTIIYGCNEFCTYCIVPYVRGKERSRRPEQIVAEVEHLAAQGCKEVMLLGQNVNAYGSDLDGGIGFAELLRQIDAVPGIERIRYTSPHPKHFTEPVIDAMAECAHVCEHVHMPAQAGSDTTLRRMGRRYTRAQYVDLVERMRARIPGLAVTTDLIVGFPGETEAEFQETLSLVREVAFDSSFMFIYSPRIGTPATRLKEQVPEDVKRERIHRLIEAQNEVSLKKNRARIGERHEVLVEGAAKHEPHLVSGRARNNRLVVFPGAADALFGQTVPVEITSAQTWSLGGRLITA